MRSGTARRKIYVRPAKEFQIPTTLWLLKPLLYVILDAERQWLCAVENWMFIEHKVESMLGVDQLLIVREKQLHLLSDREMC